VPHGRRLQILTTTIFVLCLGVGAFPAAANASTEFLYVANAGDPVTVYDAGSSGAVQPTGVISNPNLTGTFWDPWTVALDSGSNVYAQSYLSNATSFVFASGTGAPPTRVFSVTGPDSEGIAVDAQGYEYVMGGEAAPQITAAAPGAIGVPGSGYSVSPVRQFSTDQDGFNPWPGPLTIDGQGELVAAILKSAGNAIEVFQGGPNGSNTPIRSITGVDTELGSCTGFSTCDHIAVTFSTLTGDIYAAVSTTSGTHISVFAGNANGDTAPLRTISGPSTGLAANVITGIAVSQLTGDIYSMVKPSQFAGPAQVEIFGETAAGDSQPIRTFTDAATTMQNAEGIALGTTSPPAAAPEVRLTILLPLLGGAVLAMPLAIRHRRSRRLRAVAP
jgi:hypothetical protein